MKARARILAAAALTSLSTALVDPRPILSTSPTPKVAPRFPDTPGSPTPGDLPAWTRTPWIRVSDGEDAARDARLDAPPGGIGRRGR